MHLHPIDLDAAERADCANYGIDSERARKPPTESEIEYQNRYFTANWISRGATDVPVITPKVAVPSDVPGLANCG